MLALWDSPSLSRKRLLIAQHGDLFKRPAYNVRLSDRLHTYTPCGGVCRHSFHPDSCLHCLFVASVSADVVCRVMRWSLALYTHIVGAASHNICKHTDNMQEQC